MWIQVLSRSAMVPVIFLTSLIFSTAIIADSTGKVLTVFNTDTVAMPVTESEHGVERMDHIHFSTAKIVQGPVSLSTIAASRQTTHLPSSRSCEEEVTTWHSWWKTQTQVHPRDHLAET